MKSQTNQFNIITGSDKLSSLKYLVPLVLLSAVSAVAVVKMGIAVGIVITALPLVSFYLFWLFRKPVVGFYSALVLDFTLIGISRYIPGDVQIGLAMDAVLLLTYLAILFERFYDRVDWKPVRKDVTLLAAIWFGYSVLEFFNPETVSHAAWFSGMRGISLYMLLMIPLALKFVDTRRKLNTFLTLWGVFSILISLKGIVQMTVGVDPFEKQWLSGAAGQTHLIFGHLRAFSFLSDAGQFGANQAYSAVVATIVAFAERGTRRRFFFLSVAALGFTGMFLSGTRGAMSIPLAGFFLYFILRKNVWVMVSGLVLLVMVVLFFRMTYIGQSNQFIRRMRSAFNPNDPSLQVRLENQRLLKAYLATRPIGGGIGQAGVKAKPYTGNTFLSNTPTDSWYVLIWAEQGIVGLALHLFILLYILIKSAYLIMYKIRNPVLKMKMAALASGYFGVMVASYGNAVLGTMPTSLLIYTSMALMMNSPHFDNQSPL